MDVAFCDHSPAMGMRNQHSPAGFKDGCECSHCIAAMTYAESAIRSLAWAHDALLLQYRQGPRRLAAGPCSICGEPAKCVDHCHAHGWIRGPLCGRCNSSNLAELDGYCQSNWLAQALARRGYRMTDDGKWEQLLRYDVFAEATAHALGNPSPEWRRSRRQPNTMRKLVIKLAKERTEAITLFGAGSVGIHWSRCPDCVHTKTNRQDITDVDNALALAGQQIQSAATKAKTARECAAKFTPGGGHTVENQLTRAAYPLEYAKGPEYERLLALSTDKRSIFRLPRMNRLS